MVNKQYNVQGLNKKLKQQNTTTPPPSTPTTTTTTSTHLHLSNTNDSAFHNDDFDVIDHSDDNTSKVGSSLSSNGHHKDLSINDIGRFQYILQMDRELAAATQSKTVYRLPSLSSENVLSSSVPSSNSNSITSTNHLHFWKAGSQSPITSPSSESPTTRQSRQQRFNHILMVAWKFTKWPLALLLAATIIGALVYFLLLENELMTSSGTKHATDDGLHMRQNQHLSVGTSTTFGDDDELQQQERTAINFLNHYNGINRNTIRSSAASTVVPLLASNGIDPSTPITTARSVSTEFVTKFDTMTTTTTTKSPPKHAKTVIYTNSEETRRRKLPKSPPHTTLILNAKDNADENNVDRTKLLFPTKETLEIFGFTSGHQNNFGVPIEEDERILRMLNAEMLNSQRKANKNRNGDTYIVSTTDLNQYQTKVSPTLPILQKSDATTTERIRSPILNGTDDGTCQSTSLPLCRGILPYDLTNMKTSKSLTPQDLEHFQYLIESKCSMRSHGFVCAILEPECRPERMGPFMPCKRICKSILEACAHVVTSSEMLTATFDCDIYPDSNDENECKDTTRGTDCHSNEFQCADKTCIPSQWRCDNIKDCSNAEDEAACTFCGQDEFKCIGTDKCIPEKWHCDHYEDCPDASDERDCLHDETVDYVPSQTPQTNGRTFPFAHEQKLSPSNSSSVRPYLIVSGEDRYNSAESNNHFKVDKNIADAKHAGGKSMSNDTAADDGDGEDEIQGDASGITVPLSKSLANFRDSKEIMMTSDSEAEYKYSSSYNVPIKTELPTSCPAGELRCVNGNCITISQLCDKVRPHVYINEEFACENKQNCDAFNLRGCSCFVGLDGLKVTDCPDGADEAMCVYQN